jgi:CheY-like chemotaxis protein
MDELLQSGSGSFFQLRELIDEGLYAFKSKEEFQDISVHLIDDLVSPLSIKADRKRLREILDLLLMNAVKVTKPTKITISLKQLIKTQKEVLLEFTVEDNAFKHLVDAEISLFSYKRNLVEIINLIKEFGGRAEINSLEGVGTTIKFLVKFVCEDLAEDVIYASHNKLAGKKILVAEDNEINQKIINHLLRKENISVDIANDGKEAVEFFEKKNYDLLLLDLQMPHMDGFQTAKYIRKILGSCVPIIAMTAGAYANEQTRCFEIGINQYLSKPFTPEDLFLRLKYLLLNEHDLKKPKSGPVANKGLYSLNSLRQTNEEEEVIEILEMFIENTPQLLKEIKYAIGRDDIDNVVRKTAKLKGSLGSLQMQSMMKIIDEMEIAVRMEDISAIPFIMERLHREYDTVNPLLQKELDAMKIKAD